MSIGGVFLLILVGNVLFAQHSPFNGLEVLPADSTGHYRILIGGHFHGESTNRSGYPAATLLANLDTINSLGANLFLSTGDLFMDPVNDMPRYQRSLFSKLKMALFNAPGNHDGATRDTASWLGESAEAFWTGRPAPTPFMGRNAEYEFVLLNTELNEGSLDGNQLKKLEWIMGKRDSTRPSHLFIISHRPVWAEGDQQYSELFQGNTRSLTGTNFHKDVYPILEGLARIGTHVYWISGSLGGSAPSSIFFQEHAKNITYIQCAIRDEPRDALLIADVYPDTVKWSALSLTGQKLLAPEAYNAAWWREHVGKSEGFNWRMLPYLVKTTVLRKEFWWGVLGGVLVLMLIRRLYRR